MKEWRDLVTLRSARNAGLNDDFQLEAATRSLPATQQSVTLQRNVSGYSKLTDGVAKVPS
jgi:hypothetical protein